MSKDFITKYFDRDRKFVVYASIVIFSSVIIVFAEMYIIHGFQKTANLVTEQFENKIKEYRNSCGLDKNEIRHLAALMQADSSQIAILSHYLESAHNDVGDFSREDALHILEESKAVLSYQMQEVKTEYQALEIWVALMTVVFLIFSFYSFYKMDRMIDKGAERVQQFNVESKQKLDVIEMAVEKNIKDLEKEKESLLNELKNQSYLQFREMSDRCDNNFRVFSDKYTESRIRLENSVDNMKMLSQDYVGKYSEVLSRIKSIENSISLLENTMPIQKKAVDDYSNDVQLLQARMGAIEKEIELLRIQEMDVKKFESRIMKLEKFHNKYK